MPLPWFWGETTVSSGTLPLEVKLHRKTDIEPGLSAANLLTARAGFPPLTDLITETLERTITAETMARVRFSGKHANVSSFTEGFERDPS